MLPGKCYDCGADILKVPNANTGNLMVFNPRRTTEGNFQFATSGNPPLTRAVHVGKGADKDPPVALYISHRATCPNAKGK